MANTSQLGPVVASVLLLLSLSIGLCSVPFQANSPQMQYWQQQFDNMYRNLFCPRAPVRSIGCFNPGDHIMEYNNPTKMREYLNSLPATREQRLLRPIGGLTPDVDLPLLDLIIGIDTTTERGWELFYNSTIWFSQRSNVMEFTRVMEVIFAHKFFGVFQSLPFYTIYPQMYIPKSITKKINGLPDDTYKIPITSPESVVAYWRENPAFASYHGLWHMSFVFFWKPGVHGPPIPRHGETFMYTHHQIMVRYKAELLSNGIPWEPSPLTLSPPFIFPEGYNPIGLDVDLNQFPARLANTELRTAPIQNVTMEQMRTWDDRLFEAIYNGYMINDNGGQIPLTGPLYSDTIRGRMMLGSALESDNGSPNLNYYGTLHNYLHDSTGWLPSPYPVIGIRNGPIANPETSVLDPAFYHIHSLVDDMLRRLQERRGPRRRNSISYPGVMITEVSIKTMQGNWAVVKPNYPPPFPPQNIPCLTTYFETAKLDITNAVFDCPRIRNGEVYLLSMPKNLNYHAFETSFTIYNYRWYEENADIRVFISPKYRADGTPYTADDLMFNMIQLDQIPFKLKPGWNRITRNSQYNTVTGPSPGTEKGRLRRACSFPPNFYLPKGNQQGLPFVMFAMVTYAAKSGVQFTVENEPYYPSLIMCQSPVFPYPDDRPMGFPFDRPWDLGVPVIQTPFMDYSFWFIDIIIKHVGVVGDKDEQDGLGGIGIGGGAQIEIGINITTNGTTTGSSGVGSPDYGYYYDQLSQGKLADFD